MSCPWMTVGNDNLEKGLAQPLLLPTAKNEQNEEDDRECDENEEASEESRRPANSLASAYRLLTPSIKVCLFKFYLRFLKLEIIVVGSFFFFFFK